MLTHLSSRSSIYIFCHMSSSAILSRSPTHTRTYSIPMLHLTAYLFFFHEFSPLYTYNNMYWVCHPFSIVLRFSSIPCPFVSFASVPLLCRLIRSVLDVSSCLILLLLSVWLQPPLLTFHVFSLAIFKSPIIFSIGEVKGVSFSFLFLDLCWSSCFVSIVLIEIKLNFN